MGAYNETFRIGTFYNVLATRQNIEEDMCLHYTEKNFQDGAIEWEVVCTKDLIDEIYGLDLISTQEYYFLYTNSDKIDFIVFYKD